MDIVDRIKALLAEADADDRCLVPEEVSALSGAVEEIERLRQEIDFLRRYGNKDCTAMADMAMEEKRQTGKAPFED